MKNRLEQFLAAENITQSQFADKINVARAGISHILAGRNNPSYEFIINTMSAYPDLNIEWLLCGKGRMYKDNSTSADAENDTLFSGTPQSALPVSGTKDSPAVSRRGISRIVVFFNDGTFEEFC